jgi:hypothetical protein
MSKFSSCLQEGLCCHPVEPFCGREVEVTKERPAGLTVLRGGDKIRPLWCRNSHRWLTKVNSEMPPSSSGPGRSPFKAKTGVRISVGALPKKRPPYGRSRCLITAHDLHDQHKIWRWKESLTLRQKRTFSYVCGFAALNRKAENLSHGLYRFSLIVPLFNPWQSVGLPIHSP